MFAAAKCRQRQWCLFVAPTPNSVLPPIAPAQLWPVSLRLKYERRRLPVSDFERLESKLAKLARKERPSGGARRLTGREPETLLARIVAEIDEVILPRALVFSVQGADSLRLAVANRRLQALLAPLPAAMTDGGVPVGQALVAGEEEVLGRVRAALLAWLADADALGVTAERIGPDETLPAESGVPVTALARSWAIAEEELNGGRPDPQEVLSSFLAEAGDRAHAWLRIDGESVAAQGGDPARVSEASETFAEFLDTFLQRRERLTGVGDDPACIAIEADGGTMILADHGPSKALLLAQRDGAGAILAAWQRAALGA